MSTLPPLIVILGPTASGKTDLAIKLAKKISADGLVSGWKSAEIVCADSRTVYRRMDIGTAKPLPKIKGQGSKVPGRAGKSGYIIQGVPHYIIDIVKPDEEFTVAQFKNLALKIIHDIHQRGKLPFLVGGTGLYISAIVDNLEIPAVPPDKKLRKKLEQQIKKYGLPYLYQKLIKLDPEAKQFVSEDNPRRVIRALEVCLKTKKKFSLLRQQGEPLFRVLQAGVKISRPELYQKINQRTDQMIKAGLVEEVKGLGEKYSFNLPAMSGIGYRQIGLYLKNKISLNEAVELIKKDTRHYAKRQMTWFRRDKRIRWLNPNNFKQAIQLIKKSFR